MIITMELRYIVQASGSLRGGYTYTATDKYIQKGDTVILIASVSQEKLLDAIKESPLFKIIFISKPSINLTNGHGLDPRNTVVVLELSELAEGYKKPVVTAPVKPIKLSGFFEFVPGCNCDACLQYQMQQPPTAPAEVLQVTTEPVKATSKTLLRSAVLKERF